MFNEKVVAEGEVTLASIVVLWEIGAVIVLEPQKDKLFIANIVHFHLIVYLSRKFSNHELMD